MPNDLRARLAALVAEMREHRAYQLADMRDDAQLVAAQISAIWADRLAALLREPPEPELTDHTDQIRDYLQKVATQIEQKLRERAAAPEPDYGYCVVHEQREPCPVCRSHQLDQVVTAPALLREPPEEPRCRCGVPTRCSHFCCVMDHAWVAARAEAPESTR